MTELWWKVFLASIATVAVCKLLQAPWGWLLIFCAAFIGWTVALFAVMLIGDSLWVKFKKKKDEKDP